MILWGLAGALSLIVLGSILYPLLRTSSRVRNSAEYDLAVYRDQLAELERNRAQGLISEAEAEAGRTEIGRRILAADKRRREGGGRAAGGRWAVRFGAVLGGLAVVGATALYLHLGSPGKEAVPFATRDVPKTREAIVAARNGTAPQGQGGASSQAEAGSLSEMEQRLAAQLAEEPADLRGWLLLGRTRMQQQDYAGAQEAFANAHDLRPDAPRIAAAYGEALVMANQGTVTPKAQDLFEAAREGLPEDAQTNYYLALADFQQGAAREALDRWKAMVARAPGDAPWLSVVERHMAAAEAQLGLTPGETFAAVAPSPEAREGAPQNGGPQGGNGASGPTREQVEAARNMDAGDRQAMIRGMVDRLAKRLEDNPDDLEGWLRLARTYNVLEQPAKARDALARARELAPENVSVLARYARALRQAAGQRQTERSLAVSREILELDPRHPEALWFVAVHEARSGNTEAARDLFDRALAVLPDTPQTEELRRRARGMIGDG
jgi:cytochrome c-type biogenesis protein CcmH